MLNQVIFYQHSAPSVRSGGLCLFLILEAEHEDAKGEEENQNASYTWLNENVIKENFSYFYNIRLPSLLP